MALKEEKGNTMLSEAETEKLVIKLLKENKTYREITHLAGANPKQISNIKKKMKGKDCQPNVRIKSYQMFKEGKEPIDVAIALNIPKSETLEYHTEFLQLKREDKILNIKDELKDDFIAFYDLFKEMKSKFYGLKMFKEALAMARKTDEAESALVFLEMEKERTQKAVDKLNLEFSKLRNDISLAKYELESLKPSKQFLVVGSESLAQEKTITESHLPLSIVPTVLSKIEEIVRKSLQTDYH